ncbi:MAG: hypothetical protein U0R50_02115 [Gaiellales bacterium]
MNLLRVLSFIAAAGLVLVASPAGSAPLVEPLSRTATGGQPCGVVGTSSGIWVSDYGNGRLVQLDPATGEVRGRLKLAPTPCELTYGRGSLWVSTRSGYLVRVDPVARKVTARIKVGLDSDDVVVAAGSVWVANYSTQDVSRVSPTSNRVTKTVKLPGLKGGASGIAFAGGAIWVGQTQGNGVFRIDPRTNKATFVKTGLLGPAWLAGRGDVLWISNIYDKSAIRLDPRTRRVVAKVKMGADPVNLELVGDEVWVPNDQVDTVSRIDATTGELLEVVPTAENPAVVAAWEGTGWVTMFDAGEVWHLG